MRSIRMIFCTAVVIILLAPGVWGRITVLADPDTASSCLEFYGVPSAKIGEEVSFWNMYLGGFLESRNEERFDQGLLPNHNWRGFAFLYYGREFLDRGGWKGLFFSGFEHESAHPTMGFYEHNDSAYELIYDNLYRNINLNSLILRGRFEWKGVIELALVLDYQFYFCSRNTPELHDSDLSESHGISAGIDAVYAFGGKWRAFISLFDRYMFRGHARRHDNIYYDEGGTVVTRNVSYPIINGINTIVVKTGILYEWTGAGRSIAVYGKMLQGNIFGFVDSREERLQFYCGLELLH